MKTDYMAEHKASISDSEICDFLNQPSDSIVLSFEKSKLGIKNNILDVTGFYVFDMEYDEFVAKLDEIKDDLKDPENPLRQLIHNFDSDFCSQYLIYMCKREQLEEMLGENVDFTELSKKVINDLKDFLNQLKDQIVQFYSLNIKNDEIKSDLVMTYLTGLVLHKNVYFIIYNILTMNNEKRIQKLQNVFKRLEQCRPTHFGTTEVIGMDPFKRCAVIDGGLKLLDKMDKYEEKELTQDHPDITEGDKMVAKKILNMAQSTSMHHPYYRLTKKLRGLSEIENPVKKLEQMYKICTSTITKELMMFW